MVGLIAKMAVDRCITSQMVDARDGVINACVDVLSAFKSGLSSPAHGALEAPPCLQLLPLLCLGLLKSVSYKLHFIYISLSHVVM